MKFEFTFKSGSDLMGDVDGDKYVTTTSQSSLLSPDGLPSDSIYTGAHVFFKFLI